MCAYECIYIAQYVYGEARVVKDVAGRLDAGSWSRPDGGRGSRREKHTENERRRMIKCWLDVQKE